uniref:Uncharacterized protein n=1 Tax=Chromera velia CCMP2878 TaxID=1169474 RepID=A0A0G4HSJ8_9ALVE|eukprot:Cvel_8307.t1-p1 / transcript=Cvel_8307.t1 / gene=Cvel_8307 / organism=Chromera_velia_CCMP2878 / gene_product=hypothetical protein / transcript_product=hypothetical protein / location=Cvel_scaffold456:38124-39488(-) / protein_length=455 / sequence_SO=supercontig / SO=protein_coding / is_pseudo=false
MFLLKLGAFSCGDAYTSAAFTPFSIRSLIQYLRRADCHTDTVQEDGPLPVAAPALGATEAAAPAAAAVARATASALTASSSESAPFPPLPPSNPLIDGLAQTSPSAPSSQASVPRMTAAQSSALTDQTVRLEVGPQGQLVATNFLVNYLHRGKNFDEFSAYEVAMWYRVVHMANKFLLFDSDFLEDGDGQTDMQRLGGPPGQTFSLEVNPSEDGGDSEMGDSEEQQQPPEDASSKAPSMTDGSSEAEDSISNSNSTLESHSKSDTDSSCSFGSPAFACSDRSSLFRLPRNFGLTSDSQARQPCSTKSVRIPLAFSHFQSPHPLYQTDLLVCDGQRRIPNPFGMFLPNLETAPEEYAQYVLTLFRPWRQLSDLKESDEIWESAYKRGDALSEEAGGPSADTCTYIQKFNANSLHLATEMKKQDLKQQRRDESMADHEPESDSEAADGAADSHGRKV